MSIADGQARMMTCQTASAGRITTKGHRTALDDRDAYIEQKQPKHKVMLHKEGNASCSGSTLFHRGRATEEEAMQWT